MGLGLHNKGLPIESSVEKLGEKLGSVLNISLNGFLMADVTW